MRTVKLHPRKIKVSLTGKPLLILIILIILYLVISSLAYVPGGEVHLYRIITRKGTFLTLEELPLVNDSARGRLFFKQPVIPGTGIGYKSGEIKIDQVMELKTSFAFYTEKMITGNPEDVDTVRAFTISGEIAAVTDWERFIRRLNPVQYDYDTRNTPFAPRIEDRVDVLAEQIEVSARAADVPFSSFPAEGEPLGNLGDIYNFWYNELISRRNFIAALKDRFRFTEKKDFIEFLVNEAPWYYYLGIYQFESLANQGQELMNSLQSVYYSRLSRSGQAERFILNEDQLLLINMAHRAYQYEQSIIALDENIADVRENMETASNELSQEARMVVAGLLPAFWNFYQSNDNIPMDNRIAFLDEQYNLFRQEYILQPLVYEMRYQKLILGLLNFQEMLELELGGLTFSSEDQAMLEEILADIIENYYTQLNPEEWERYQTDFNSIFQIYVQKYPGFVPSENAEFLYWIYMSLLDYYLKDIEQDLLPYHHHIERTPALQQIRGLLLSQPGFVQSSMGDMVNGIYKLAQEDPYRIFEVLSYTIGQQSQLEIIRGTKTGWEDIRKTQLIPFFNSFNGKMADTEFLWDAAIDEVLEGPSLAEFRDYQIYRTRSGDHLSSIAERLDTSGLQLFLESIADLEFSSQEDQIWFENSRGRVTQADLYSRLMFSTLKPGIELVVYSNDRFSPVWWEQRAEAAEKRELLLKQFAYPVIEQNLPYAFDLFIEETPYMRYLEFQYGVQITNVSIAFSAQPLFSNPASGVVNPDFYNVYETEVLETDQ